MNVKSWQFEGEEQAARSGGTASSSFSIGKLLGFYKK